MAALRVPYKQVGDVSIPTDVHLPAASAVKNTDSGAPVIIIIHGGGFMLGWSGMNNRDQIQDCLDRGWIVLSIEHRLCPGLNLLEGPMTDVRDLFDWARSSQGLQKALTDHDVHMKADDQRVMAMGTSAGGHLSLSLCWHQATFKPLAILDFYGPKDFADPAWKQPVEQIRSKLPPRPSEDTFSHLFQEKTVYQGGVSLEGQAGGPPDLKDPRQAYVMHSIAEGRVLEGMWPPKGPQTDSDFQAIDPIRNIDSSWPPVAIVHGNADFMVPIHLSRKMHAELEKAGVKTTFIEVDGEPHTFVGKMQKGSKTWHTQRKGFDWLEQIVDSSYA